MRQRVRAALTPCAAPFLVCSNRAVTPEASAASCKRRLCPRSRRPTSPTTMARPAHFKASSMAHRRCCSSRPRTRINCSEPRPNAASPGPYKPGPYKPRSDRHHSTRPARCSAARRAANTAVKARAAPLPRPLNTSCKPPRARPPPGKCPSMPRTPRVKGGKPRWSGAGACSMAAIHRRNAATACRLEPLTTGPFLMLQRMFLFCSYFSRSQEEPCIGNPGTFLRRPSKNSRTQIKI